MIWNFYSAVNNGIYGLSWALKRIKKGLFRELIQIFFRRKPASVLSFKKQGDIFDQNRWLVKWVPLSLQPA